MSSSSLTGAELAAILGQVPRRPPQPLPGALRDAQAVARRLLAGELTIGQALERDHELVQALSEIEQQQSYRRVKSEGEQLCEPCDLVPAVAAPAPCAW